MWRYAAMVVVFITLVNSNEIFIWQNGLFGCLQNRGQHSVVDTYTNLFQWNIINYCGDNSFKRFTRTPCGYIRSTSGKTNMQWWISQSKRTVLKWNIIEFMVLKSDAHCSFSHVAWMTESKQSYYCGHHLPWKEFTKGNVTIIQQFILTVKRPSYFKLFFNVEHHKSLIPPKKKFQIDVNKVVHISPRFSYSEYCGDLMLFLIGPFPFQVLDITVTSMKGNVLQDLTIYDGPSLLTPMLSRYNINGNNYTHETRRTSSFQALLVVSMNTLVHDTASASWSSHIKKVEAVHRCSHKIVPYVSTICTGHYFRTGWTRHGLILMMIHTKDTTVDIKSIHIRWP